MNCTNCGRPITDNLIGEDGYYFCNALCRYEWRKKGKPNPYSYIHNSKLDDNKRITEIDLDFPIEPKGFEGRKFIIRPSFWGTTKIYIDGKKLKPIKRRIFSRNREYIVNSNFGNDVKISIKYKFMDFIPVLYIDDQIYQIARPLNILEYTWIFIPLLLMFGGSIGGLIGAAAVFSNSLLFRKIKQIFPRYLFTGLTTIMAFSIYIQVIGFLNPYIIKIAPPSYIEQQLRITAKKMNRNCPVLLDNETRLDSINASQVNHLNYYFTLVNRSKNDLNIEIIENTLKKQIIQNIKTEEGMKDLRELDIIFNYVYYDKDKYRLIEIPIIPNDYK